MKIGRPGLKIGLLGGGQLARMLAQKGSEIGFEMSALSESAQDPVGSVVLNHQVGSLKSERTLRQFIQNVDVVTFESEFLDAQLLSAVLKKLKSNKKIQPRPELMHLLQDRLSQKQILLKHSLPTLPFIESSSFASVKSFLQNNGPLVLKKRRFGYDGYGTFHISSLKQLERFFKNLKDQQNSDLIAEPRCRFQRELAFSFCRSQNGDIVEFPLVETRQQNNRCLWVKGPVHHRQKRALSKRIQAFLRKIDYVGIMAFELFDTGHDLVINEIAPRVHNSAHYSQNATTPDQFTAHLLAISGFSLPKIVLHNRGFAMINLLGESTRLPKLSLQPGIHLHWYGKLENRPGRKMGHLNAVASTPQKALQLVQKARGKYKL